MRCVANKTRIYHNYPQCVISYTRAFVPGPLRPRTTLLRRLGLVAMSSLVMQQVEQAVGDVSYMWSLVTGSAPPASEHITASLDTPAGLALLGIYCVGFAVALAVANFAVLPLLARLIAPAGTLTHRKAIVCVAWMGSLCLSRRR